MDQQITDEIRRRSGNLAGVEFLHDGKTYLARASKEVILWAG